MVHITLPTLKALVNRLCRQRPDEADRIQRGSEYVRLGYIAFSDGIFTVGLPEGHHYPYRAHCPCPDATYRVLGRRCKHYWALQIWKTLTTPLPDTEYLYYRARCGDDVGVLRIAKVHPISYSQIMTFGADNDPEKRWVSVDLHEVDILDFTPREE